MPTLFEYAGGAEAIHRLEQIFYASVLTDPLLQPLFGAGRPEHVDHLTAFTAESFGGPDRFSRDLGFDHLISVHRGLEVTEAQRRRFVELYMTALDDAEMPTDLEFREAVREHVEFGSRVAMHHVHRGTCRRGCSSSSLSDPARRPRPRRAPGPGVPLASPQSCQVPTRRSRRRTGSWPDSSSIYELDGDSLTIWGGEKGSPAYFRGTFDPEGRRLRGSWVWPGGGYDATMTRTD